MDNATLFKSDALIEHATVVMEMFDVTVTELDDADKTHAKLKKLGLKHKTRGIPEDVIKVSRTRNKEIKIFINFNFKIFHFLNKDMRDPFLKAVDQTLGDRFTDRMRNIYEVFIDYLINTLIEGYTSA